MPQARNPEEINEINEIKRLLHNQVVESGIVNFTANPVKREEASRKYHFPEGGENNFAKLAISKLASTIFDESQKASGEVGEGYESAKNNLINIAVAEGLFTELLIDGRVETIAKKILLTQGLEDNNITGLLRYDTPARASIISCAKHALRKSMLQESDIVFDNEILTLNIAKVAGEIAIKVGSNNSWLGAPDEAQAINDANALLSKEPSAYVKKLISILPQLDFQKEELARQILRAARLEPARIDSLLKTDNAGRKAIFAIA